MRRGIIVKRKKKKSVKRWMEEGRENGMGEAQTDRQTLEHQLTSQVAFDQRLNGRDCVNLVVQGAF